MSGESGPLRAGEIIGPVEVGSVAHGGHWVVRHEGRVIFVRHALGGETVRVRVTQVAKRHAFGDVVEVVAPSPFRVVPPCPIAAGCGGCDFQHVERGHQRVLKTQVLAEQLQRMAGVAWSGEVEDVAPGEGWRTRVRYHLAEDGTWGMHPYHSSAVTPLPDAGCLIAAPGLQTPPTDADGPELLGVASDDGPGWYEPRDGRLVRQHAAGRSWDVRADGFWQVHPAAADTLVDAVLTGLDPHPGETALDLYCGVGLFAGALVDRGVDVIGVEGSRTATDLARRNVPEAQFLAGDVDRRMDVLPLDADLIVLDPPRSGAGASVMRAVLERRPRAIAYVACDPAALARDLRTAIDLGWTASSIRAFDLFGMTHHLESVAILEPGRR